MHWTKAVKVYRHYHHPHRQRRSKHTVQQYIQCHAEHPEKDMSWIESTCHEVSVLSASLKTALTPFKRKSLFCTLDGCGRRRRLQRNWYFSVSSTNLSTLGLAADAPLLDLKAKAWELHKRWRLNGHRLPQDMQDALINRLDLILDELDKIDYTKIPGK